MEGMALTEAVYYILLSLVQPLHGYGIMQRAEALSGGRVKLAAGRFTAPFPPSRSGGGLRRCRSRGPAGKRNTG